MQKKGLSDVITTLIIVLLSLVAIGIVWVVISNIIKSGEQQTSFQFGTLFLDLQLEKVTVNADDSVSVTVKRGVGEGELAGVAFVFSDGEKSITLKKTVVLSELGSQSFSFTQAELSELAFVKQVEIAPILSSDNKEQVGRVVDMEKSAYLSCLNILNSGESKGDGVYTIDTDGIGSEKEFSVYCDMTTDGGGWTRFIRHSDANGLIPISQASWDSGIERAAKGKIKEWLIKTWGSPLYSSETKEPYINAWVRDMPDSYARENFVFFKYQPLPLATDCNVHRYHGAGYGSTRILSGSHCTALDPGYSGGYLWGEHRWCAPSNSIGWMWIDHCGSPILYHLLVVNHNYNYPPAGTTLVGSNHPPGTHVTYDEDGGTFEFFYREETI